MTAREAPAVWLADRYPDGGDRSRHIGARLLDVTSALVVAADDTEAEALTAAVAWGGNLPASEIAAVAAGLVALAVEELARATGAPAAAVIQRLREAAERHPMELPTREEAR